MPEQLIKKKKKKKKKEAVNKVGVRVARTAIIKCHFCISRSAGDWNGPSGVLPENPYTEALTPKGRAFGAGPFKEVI